VKWSQDRDEIERARVTAGLLFEGPSLLHSIIPHKEGANGSAKSQHNNTLNNAIINVAQQHSSLSIHTSFLQFLKHFIHPHISMQHSSAQAIIGNEFQVSLDDEG
jgi:hypothetical protein